MNILSMYYITKACEFSNKKQRQWHIRPILLQYKTYIITIQDLYYNNTRPILLQYKTYIITIQDLYYNNIRPILLQYKIYFITI